jgi:hypothetical protein
VSAISDLEHKVSDLEHAGLPHATLSTCAVLQIMHAIGGCRPGSHQISRRRANQGRQ